MFKSKCKRDVEWIMSEVGTGRVLNQINNGFILVALRAENFNK